MRQAMVLGVAVLGIACSTSPTGTPPPVMGASPSPAPSPPPTPMVTPSPEASPSPSPPPSRTVVVRTANLRGANGHNCSGTARILREGDAYFLELGEDFRIDSGNNDVMLTQGESTRLDSDLNLGPMRSLTGRQRYAMPGPADRFPHVMLWCRPFRVPIGIGRLR